MKKDVFEDNEGRMTKWKNKNDKWFQKDQKKRKRKNEML
jgi:hypothetical protein